METLQNLITDRASKFLKGFSLCSCALALLCTHAISYAQEQDIAESFGMYSKGIDYYHKGKLYEAKETLERAVRLDSRNDEAQGYLDLVNAEIRMRNEGKLDFYQGQSELKRESTQVSTYGVEQVPPRRWNGQDPMPEIEPYEESDNPEGYYQEEPIDNSPKNKGKIRGEYKMSAGVTGDDFIWKKANGDYNERNFRMIDHNFPKANTFDTRVFDRFRVMFDTNPENNGLNFHSDITVDPWSFTGKTKKFTVDSAWGDAAEFELKYWSGTSRTINETFYSSRLGNSFGLSEIKVKDGDTSTASVSGTGVNEFGLSDSVSIPEKEIDFMFQPVRELWFDFKGDSHGLRIFPLGLEDQAFTSDDPLGLSNHHIYWEASPWLYDWVPGHVNTGTAPNDFWAGKWSNSLAHFTRDSDLRRLTALRGLSFHGAISANSSIAGAIAAPKTLWQDYDSVTALPGALRLKTQAADNLMLGIIDTFRIGYNDGTNDSYNNVIGLDMGYDVSPTARISAEAAVSKSENDRNSFYKTDKNGSAGHIAFKEETGIGKIKFAFTHMDEAFDPGLANYKETRKDQSWGRHIHFKKPLEYTSWGSSTLKYDDIDPFRIGDGVDTGRDVLNLRLDKKDAFDKKMDNLIDYRNVRDSSHKYVESVLRGENVFRVNPEWTSKLLLLYHDLPKTKGGIDPIQYDTVTGEYLKNTAVEDGKDPSLTTYSAGLEYAPEEWISVFGIYENTNDYTFAAGNYPRGLLNSTYFTTETIGGKVYRKEVPQLYSQGYFDMPPYEHFNIYRGGILLKPSHGLGIELDYTKNDFKFAGGIDDNINHFGAALKYEFSQKLTGFLKYTFSRAYNLYRLNTSGNLKYQSHHNVFIEMDYIVSEDGLLVVQFGEGSVISPVWSATVSPFGDFYPTLDTQHIIRVYYNGRF